MGLALAGTINIFIFVLKDIFKLSISGYILFGGFPEAGAFISLILTHIAFWSYIFYYFVTPYLWDYVLAPIAGIFINNRGVENAILRGRKTKMERIKGREGRRKEKEYQSKVGSINKQMEEKQEELREIRRRFPSVTEEVPEALDYLSEDFQYRGPIGELARRVQDRQASKSIETRREALTQAKLLLQEMGQLRKAEADLTETYYEANVKETKISIKEKRAEDIRQQAELEVDMETQELENKKAKLLLEQARTLNELNLQSAQESPSEEERIRKEIEKTIEALAALGWGVDVLESAKAEALSKIDETQNPRLYRLMENVWANEMIRFMERRQR